MASQVATRPSRFRMNWLAQEGFLLGLNSAETIAEALADAHFGRGERSQRSNGRRSTARYDDEAISRPALLRSIADEVRRLGYPMHEDHSASTWSIAWNPSVSPTRFVAQHAQCRHVSASLSAFRTGREQVFPSKVSNATDLLSNICRPRAKRLWKSKSRTWRNR
jgi:hypothetical protein